ncbi:hypothetical protein ACFV84_38295 [Kitasatospora sp. NPDC059811]|nr:hypothetical protein [Streptomyces sp. MJM8645]
MTRTPQEVFADHGRRLGAGGLDHSAGEPHRGLISAQTVRYTLADLPR